MRLVWGAFKLVHTVLKFDFTGFFLIVILEDRAGRNFLISIWMGKNNKFEKNFLKISSIWNVIIENSVPNKRTCAFIH